MCFKHESYVIDLKIIKYVIIGDKLIVFSSMEVQVIKIYRLLLELLFDNFLHKIADNTMIN